MTRRLLAGLAALTFLAASCKVQNPDEAQGTDDEEQTTTTAGGGAGAATFGSLESPCGPGDGKVAEADAGRGTDKLYIGVANDRGSSFRQGLNKELWDMGVAFTGWCNAQGGIAGLPVEAVDLDGKVLNVGDAMATACADVFAMVGGGFVQDDMMFSGKEGADFHKCKLIAIPGFAVSTAMTEANGQVQPIPNPAYVKPTAWMTSLAKLYPDEVKNLAAVWGKLPSIESNKSQNLATARKTKGFDKITEFSYDAIGNQNWALIAQQVKEAGATAVNFVGEPGNMSKMSQALKDSGYRGIYFSEANQYDQVLIDSSGPGAVEGAIVRIATHPYEEADRWPATKKLIEIFKQYGPPDGKLASLSNQSFSAFLLFATAAKACADQGEITRDCVLGQAKKVTRWDGGGLHSSGNPAKNTPAECAMLLQIKGGKFERLFPKLGSDDDNGQGFFCADPPTMPIEGDFGTGNVDPTRKV